MTENEGETREVGFYEKASRAIARIPSKFGPEVQRFRRHRSIMEFWLEWFEGENEENIEYYRILTAWRIVRYMAQMRGLFSSPNETLMDATKILPSPWVTPFSFYLRETDDAEINRLCRLHQPPLLPPDVPEAFDGPYDPCKDQPLMAYLRIAEKIAIRILRVNRSKEGRLGLTGLLDPDAARSAWPSPSDIMAYEEYLISKIYDSLISADSDGGDSLTRDELRKLDLTEMEINQLFALARARASKVIGIEDPKAFLYMQLAQMTALADKMTRREDYRGAAQARRDVLRILSMNEENQDEEDLDSIVEGEMKKESRKRRKSTGEEDIIDV